MADGRARGKSQANMLADLRGWSSFIGLQMPYSLTQRTVECELVTQLVEGREHVPVVMAKGVDNIIRRDDAMKVERLAAAGFDWAQKRTFPNVVGAGGVRLTFGDITLTSIDVGEKE
jgi:hypothetical protein